MRRKTLFGLVLGLSALLAVGGLFAATSFDLIRTLVAWQPGVSRSGTQTLALPFNQQAHLVDADDLCQDINAAAGLPVVNKIVEFLPAVNGLNPYDCVTGTPFPLVAGEAYYVQVVSNVDYRIIGTHDPGLVINLKGPGANSLDGTNFYGYPYHSVAGDASDLCQEIDAAAGLRVVNKIVEFLPATDGLNVYDCVTGTPFPLVPTRGYQVQVTQNAAFVPAHY